MIKFWFLKHMKILTVIGKIMAKDEKIIQQ